MYWSSQLRREILPESDAVLLKKLRNRITALCALIIVVLLLSPFELEFAWYVLHHIFHFK
jgi:hypothetical protein